MRKHCGVTGKQLPGFLHKCHFALFNDRLFSDVFAHTLGFSLLNTVFLFFLRGVLRYSNFSYHMFKSAT